MNASDSDDDLFQSADESLSDSDSIAPQPVECQLNTSSNSPPGTEPEEEDTQTVKSYRKKPPRRPAKELQKNSKLLQKEVINIVKSVNPETRVRNLTSQLSTNISKGLSTFQQTSSTIKDLMFQSEKREDKFVYDERIVNDVHNDNENNKPEIKSNLNEEILKLSEAFAKLQSTQMLAENNNENDEKFTCKNDSNFQMNERKEIEEIYADLDQKEENENKCKTIDLENNVEQNVTQPQETSLTHCSEIELVGVSAIEKETIVSQNAVLHQNVDGTLFKDKIDKNVKTKSVDVIKEHKLVVSNVPSEHTNSEGLTVSSGRDLLNVQVTENVEDSNFSKNGSGNENVTKLEKHNTEEENKTQSHYFSKESDICKDSVNKLIEKPKDITESTRTEKEESFKIGDGWEDWEEDTDQDVNVIAKNENKVDTSLTDEWETWDSKESSTEKDKSTNKIKVGNEDDGWGDWGDQDLDLESPLTNEIHTQSSNHIKENTNTDSWGDWEDFGNEEEPPGQKQRMEEKLPNWEQFGQKKEGSWGLGKWGVGSILSTVSNVIEQGLGVPDPETMAKLHRDQEQESSQLPETQEREKLSFPFSTFVEGVTKIVEVSKVQEIGSRVLSGGLDTLETLGKKTMDVLQDGDPGLRKKKALFFGQGSVLSQVLREAKERAEAEDKRLQGKRTERKCHFESLFDDYQGLVHLEALEMLSRQCKLKLEQMQLGLAGADVDELLQILDEVKQICEIDEDEFDISQSSMGEFSYSMLTAVEPIKNEFFLDRIIQIHDKTKEWIKCESENQTNPKLIYEKAISHIAELTAATTQQFHKAGELLLVKERRKTVEEADTLLKLSSYLCCEITTLSHQAAKLLSGNRTLVENLQVESGNAVSYVKQAFGLLVPVLQLGAT